MVRFPDSGRLLENLVFLALRRRTREVYYYASRAGFEVDFYLPETQQLIQFAQNLGQPPTREREVRALTDAMRGLDLSRGLILTDVNAVPIRVNGMTIEVRSLVEWLLEPQCMEHVGNGVRKPEVATTADDSYNEAE